MLGRQGSLPALSVYECSGRSPDSIPGVEILGRAWAQQGRLNSCAMWDSQMCLVFAYTASWAWERESVDAHCGVHGE